MIQRMLAIWSLVPLPFLRIQQTNVNVNLTLPTMAHHVLLNLSAMPDSFVTLWTEVHRSPAHDIFQARIRTLEWVAVFSSTVSSWPRDQTQLSWIGRGILYHWVTVPWIMKAFTSNQKYFISHWHLCITDLLVILQMKKNLRFFSSWWVK